MPLPQALAFQAPSLALLAAEPLRALIELCAGKVAAPATVRGDGHPVIIYPGLGAGALNTAQLRSYLRSCNLDVHDWEFGVNTGPDGALHEWLDALVAPVRAQHAREGRRVSLVGWSLGGIYAREIAKRCPDAVRQVITLGTPHRSIQGGNHAGTILRWMGGDTSQLTPELAARLAERPPVPTSSIYSESDGFVSWRGCLEDDAPDVENIAVDASHLGMPTHPEVLRIVANRLVQAEGRWRPYHRQRTRRTAR